MFFLFNFLLDIFFIYISNDIPKVPQSCSPTHPLPVFGPGVPLYWDTGTVEHKSQCSWRHQLDLFIHSELCKSAR